MSSNLNILKKQNLPQFSIKPVKQVIARWNVAFEVIHTTFVMISWL